MMMNYARAVGLVGVSLSVMSVMMNADLRHVASPRRCESAEADSIAEVTAWSSCAMLTSRFATPLEAVGRMLGRDESAASGEDYDDDDGQSMLDEDDLCFSCLARLGRAE
jgi:hypothetical protein